VKFSNLGILGSHMKYIGTSSLLQSTSSNLKSSSRLSSKTREEEREKRRSDLKRRKEKQRDESSRVESVKSTNLSSRDRDSNTRLSSKRDEEERNHSKLSVRSNESLRGQHASRGRGRGMTPVAQSRTTTETSDGQLYGRADPPPSRRQPVDYDQYRRRRGKNGVK
jgi:hypothetical protein